LALAVVIGGGFYGASIAVYLRQARGLARVVLLERGDRLLTRSSFVNQARVHLGYHYPRSFTTAYRSIVNAPRFTEEFGKVVFRNFTKLYAMARRNSKVTVRQMERLCAEIGAPLEPASAELTNLFNPALIERAYLAEEYAFDADILRSLMEQRLRESGVEVLLDSEVTGVHQSGDGVAVAYERQAERGGERRVLDAQFAFNCTYSRLQTVLGSEGVSDPLGLKHEISEMILVEPPPELAKIGITVMDGPFFSMMPFPARKLHSLSHVRYTPHAHWQEVEGLDPYARLADYHFESRGDRMVRDAARYVPAIARAKQHTSLFEVKTVLTRSEGDDGRPILLRRHAPYGRLFSILGGKIDNIYDIIERLDAEPLDTGR
jgi:glycine/D-amino acid oxidase-like deaminating enzyme